MYTKLTLIFTLLANICIAAPMEEKPYTVHQGKHKHALYKIVVPKKWNKKLLLLAHGGRPVNAPVSADFRIEGSFFESLIKSGWMVAESSYRRNGIFVNDAVLDIKDLMGFIDTKYGKPDRIYLSGASMGGKIGVQIAEEKNNRLDGVLAVGSALWCEDKVNPTALTYDPQTSVLFYSNHNEAKGPQQYLEKSKNNTKPPILWTSSRKGHCNLNKLEKAKAFKALVAWSELGQCPKSGVVDIKIKRKDSTAKHLDGKISAKALSVHAAHGSYTLDCSQADLDKAGLKVGDTFFVSYKGQQFKTYLGQGYGDVPRGKWIAFITADDYLRLARNYASAKDLLQCPASESIIINPVKKTKPVSP